MVGSPTGPDAPAPDLPDPNANLLAEAASPYLLQHADNPVAWRPWGPAALAEAKARNVPILLSVGYAACHWCHVMAHESFEDPDTAAILNPRFVAVKVDREERPDIDSIYQAALAMTGQQGGWPLTMFLTPEGEPFWGGTYFPKGQRYGRPGFVDVLRVLSEAWAEESDQIRGNVAALRTALARLSESAAGDGPSVMHADMVAGRLLQEFDADWGGIGGAPKFPQPSILELLWRHWRRTEKSEAKTAVVHTLRQMAEGGLYDHLRGGFARYSTDREWLAPHFEKMLYDNAQLIDVMTLVWRDTKDPLLAARTAETVDWIAAEMIAEGGAFAATLDADSEGEEGRFYVWDKAEVDRLLQDRAPAFNAVYDVTEGGNWEGKTILNRRHHPGWRGEEEEAALAEDRAKLLAARATRVRPGWDDKVLADWNGLTIAALAEASRVFDRPDWLAMAVRAFDFIETEMIRDGRLHHAWRDGRLSHLAMLDDLANMARGALCLFFVTGDDRYRARAEGWVAEAEAHFWDEAGGGFFFTADDAEALIVRTKTVADNAVPAGNGTLLRVYAKLWQLTGNAAYRDRAEGIAQAFAGEMDRNIFPLSTYLNGIASLHEGQLVTLIGPRDPADPAAAETRALERAVLECSRPGTSLLSVAPGTALPAGHPAAGKGMVKDRPTAYLCRGLTCLPPFTDAATLKAALAQDADG